MLSERLDRWADGEPAAMTVDDVSRILAELIEVRRLYVAAVVALSERRAQ